MRARYHEQAMRRERRSASARGGFTLLELMLAAAIAGVVGVALFLTLDTAFDTRRRAIEQLAGRNAARISLDLIGHDLEGMLGPGGLMAGPVEGEHLMAANGVEADWISFVTTHRALPIDSQKGDLRRVELAPADDPDGAEGMLLVRRVTTNLLSSSEPQQWTQILARGVRGFRLRYFDGDAWVDGWDSVDQRDMLPQAIEITLTLRPPRDLRQRGRVLFEVDDLLTMTRLVAPDAAVRSGDGLNGGNRR